MIAGRKKTYTNDVFIAKRSGVINVCMSALACVLLRCYVRTSARRYFHHAAQKQQSFIHNVWHDSYIIFNPAAVKTCGSVCGTDQGRDSRLTFILKRPSSK